MREQFGWIWAVFEAKRGWDSYDEYLVRRAQSHRLTAEELGDFAVLYNVSRTIVRGSYQELADIANETLGRSVTSREDAAILYNGFLDSIENYGSNGRPWVFASKLLWLYQPEHWMMFDNLSQDALKQFFAYGRKRMVERQFHQAVLEIFPDSAVEAITELSRALRVDYPYPLRVIDKYLFLRGGRMQAGQSWLDCTAWAMGKLAEPPSPNTVAQLVSRILPNSV